MYCLLFEDVCMFFHDVYDVCKYIYLHIYIYILYLLILRYIKHIFLKWYLKISQRLWVFFSCPRSQKIRDLVAQGKQQMWHVRRSAWRCRGRHRRWQLWRVFSVYSQLRRQDEPREIMRNYEKFNMYYHNHTHFVLCLSSIFDTLRKPHRPV
jgi:hypothetical protein